MKTLKTFPALLAILVAWFSLSGSALADWILDNSQSGLYFVSIKKQDVAEIHTFNHLSGTVNTTGQSILAIDLASLQTNIDVRNERMRDHLFETGTFTSATVLADLGSKGLQPGIRDLDVTLELHGMQKQVSAKVAVTEVGNSLQVATVAPVILNAADFGLASGIATLREIASLDSISTAVPVTFWLTFVRE